jgi:hypothetical protein
VFKLWQELARKPNKTMDNDSIIYVHETYLAMRYLSSISLAVVVHVLLSIVVLMALACTATPERPEQSGQASVLKEAIEEAGQESVDKQAEREAEYVLKLDPIGDNFYANKAFYNSELERIGKKVRTATNDQELLEAYEEVIAMFEFVADQFRQDLDDVRLIPPAPRFKEFHLLLVDAIEDIHGSTQAFLTLYSMALNSGVIDEDLALRASALHESGNEKSLEVGYMYHELCPKCD